MDEKLLEQRVQFASDWLQKLDSGKVQLQDLWFMDVITVLKNPHPKGEHVKDRAWC
eukprot:CAMPEP_0202913522 /NCGR_PEP_ID=MMETSP1392-20130828/60700_1 /ASSEMBLY_ACC=CAM_ASM_000868 /TAXON_ID=225041 /ORGANISM="Chlamydomonas chlamydogama, Strain SAG 11-48b" /LENGTH=55 /DNA_ID=CAMNT_0049604809 /DNA_START=11 /DNA_END=178 /DNA_ORIENTATION=-